MTSCARVSPPERPMSATITSPAWKRPGPTAWPTFRPWNVTVSVAWTPAPATRPVDASTPDGTSTETTGTPSAPSASIRAAASPRGAPENPVPKSASTTTSAPPSSSAATGTSSSRARARQVCASPDTFSSGPVSTTHASRPASRSRRAATNPSPPFAPVPHQTPIRRASGQRSCRTAATTDPARSIRSSVGPSYASSTARISAAVKSGSRLTGPRRRRSRQPGRASASSRGRSRPRRPGRSMTSSSRTG